MNRPLAVISGALVGVFWLLGLLWALGPPWGPEDWPGPPHTRAARVLLVLAAGLAVVGVAGWVSALRLRRWVRRQSGELARQSAILRQTRSAQQALLDHNDALIMHLDDQGRYVMANRACLEYLGCQLEDIRGKYVEEHLTPAGAARLHDYLDLARSGQEIRQRREPWELNGQQRFIDLYLKALEPGGAEGFIIILQDRTDEKRLDERLWQTERLASLGLLAAGVAHQINNPLGILLGFAEMAQGKIPEGQPGSREAGIILQQGRECQRIVDGLLHFTRFSDLGTGHGDLLASLRAVVQVLDGVLEARGVTLELDLPQRLPPSAADGGAMQQVFLNLIGNAMDAMEGGGVLAVRAREETRPPRQGSRGGRFPPGDGYLEITFTDNGQGIAPQHLDRVFDPFFTTKPVGRGTGLGLSVAYGLVREYHGVITCASPPPNQERGTQFTLRLPLAQRAGAGNGATA